MYYSGLCSYCIYCYFISEKKNQTDDLSWGAFSPVVPPAVSTGKIDLKGTDISSVPLEHLH